MTSFVKCQFMRHKILYGDDLQTQFLDLLHFKSRMLRIREQTSK